MVGAPLVLFLLGAAWVVWRLRQHDREELRREFRQLTDDAVAAVKERHRQQQGPCSRGCQETCPSWCPGHEGGEPA